MQNTITEPNLGYLTTLIQNTMTYEASVRIKAEQDLKELEKQPYYVSLLLRYIADGTMRSEHRLMVTVLLKNLVKKDWDVNLILRPEDKELIKKGCVDLLFSASDTKIQDVLSEIITIISEFDFYKNWTSLLPYLVNQLRTNSSNFETVRGVLFTCHSIFKKYREQSKTDEIEDELIYIMKEFADPMFHTFQGFISSLSQITNPNDLKLIFTCINLLLEIFYSLNWVDIPEYFEEHVAEYSSMFNTILNYDNPALDNNLIEEPGLLDEAKRLVCQSINLYLEKYDEIFIPYVEIFATSVWQLLSKLDSKMKYDAVVSKAIEFLTLVSRSEKHAIFKNALAPICDNIIIPNISLREEDEIIFAEEPIEYIRRDIEGSDTESRRRSAQELIKCLSIYYEKDIADNFLQKIHSLLQNNDWKSRDAAIFLLTCISVKASIQRKGATVVSQYVGVMNFLSTQIVPQLQASSHPIIQADAIKFICTFRQHLPKDSFPVIFPLTIQLLYSYEPVVQTYAAWCIERLLVVRDENDKPRFTQQDVLPFAEQLLQGLFHALDNTEENEYIMKAIMRSTAALKEQMKPIMPAYISKITEVLGQVCKNPNNPKFNHYLFESYATVIRFNRDYISEFEASLFPPFQTILTSGIEEFTPYVFQLISQLLSIRQPPLPQAYLGLFPNFLSANLWESEGNVPGLVAYVATFITKAPQELAKNNQLQQVLGIFQTLVMSKTKDYHGFRILDSLISTVPYEQLSMYMVEIFKVLFTRLQKKKTGQFVRCLIIFFSNFVVKYGAKALLQTINQIQQGIFPSLAKVVWESSLKSISGRIEKKVCAVALAQILFHTDLIQTSVDTWKMLLDELVAFLEGVDKAEEEEEVFVDDDETVLHTERSMAGGYKVTFTKLSFAAMGIEDPVKEVQNSKQYLAQSLSSFVSQLDPQQVQFVRSLILSNPTTAKRLYEYLQSNGFNPSFLQ
ncbi:hypothetical protein C9374_003084 [Naegleria lovaniensis]|uniref:Importin N-terminal domain-containing protein n=1 Tax=Naegleria lovaniensis TaxID=51637 RepID=A0AA88GSA3_NAELO|nr:uncharacterized protein C9374_003084 [Naegleria lovaniensis]KAG2385935.1 hypothetical protein C9374_003084 [Naegleria lovaniensis]